MMALDMSELGTGALKWIHVAKSLDKRSALVSEGLSLQAVPSQGALIAFGGYNGKYHNDVHVFKPSYAANINSVRHPSAHGLMQSERPGSCITCRVAESCPRDFQAPVLAAKIHVSSPRPKASGDASLDSAETAPLLVKQETKQTLPPQSNGNSKAEVEARMEVSWRTVLFNVSRPPTAAQLRPHAYLGRATLMLEGFWAIRTTIGVAGAALGN